MGTASGGPLWRIEDLVERWGVTRETVLFHIRENELPYIDIGTGKGRRPDYRFRPAAVEAWEASRERAPIDASPVPPLYMKEAGWDGKFRSTRGREEGEEDG
jgi:Helix-turn-helix domain